MDTIEGKTVWTYLRVSTDAQDVANQKMCVMAAAMKLDGYTINECSDTASGSVSWRERGIGKILDQAKPGDMIMVSEISRLARSTLDALEIFRAAAERGTTVVAVKNGITMDGSLSARITGTMLAMAAEIERAMIAARTKEALDRRREQGLPLGRPRGETTKTKLDGKEIDIEGLLAAGVAKSAIARLYSVSRGTLDRALKIWGEQQ